MWQMPKVPRNAHVSDKSLHVMTTRDYDLDTFSFSPIFPYPVSFARLYYYPISSPLFSFRLFPCAATTALTAQPGL